MATKHDPHDQLEHRRHVWRDFKSDHAYAEARPVNANVVALAGFLGCWEDDPGARTYHLIVEKCGSQVYTNRLMELATQFKWESSVRPLQLKIMCLYIACVVLDVAALLSCILPGISAGQHSLSWPQVGVVGLMFAAESFSFLNEMRQLGIEGLTHYFGSPWNVCDLCSSAGLAFAAGIFLSWHSGNQLLPVDNVNTFAGVGILTKTLGMLDYMRLYDLTASHVRMIASITTDVMPFLIVIALGLFSVTISFSGKPPLYSCTVGVYHAHKMYRRTNLAKGAKLWHVYGCAMMMGVVVVVAVLVPEQSAFDFGDGSLGLMRPFLSSFQMLVGCTSLEEGSGPIPIGVFMFATAFLTILMLNMVIANMGGATGLTHSRA